MAEPSCNLLNCEKLTDLDHVSPFYVPDQRLRRQIERLEQSALGIMEACPGTLKVNQLSALDELREIFSEFKKYRPQFAESLQDRFPEKFQD